MVCIKYPFRVGNRAVDTTLFTPWQANQGFNVVANHRGLGRHRRHQLELLELGFSLLERIFGQLGRRDFLFKLFNVRAFFALTQLFLNGLDLLVQVVVALTLFHLLLDATTNALFDLKNINFRLKLRKQFFKTLDGTDNLEQILLLFDFQRQMCRDGIGQTRGFVNTAK